MKKNTELDQLHAVETEQGFDIVMNGDTLVSVERLKVNTYGRPRFKVTNHVWQGLPRLECTYRKSGAEQFIYWSANDLQLATLIMKTLLSSPWNGVE